MTETITCDQLKPITESWVLLQLVAMTRELEQLGGGEARLGQAWVCCCGSPNLSGNTASSTLESQQAGLCIKDPRNSHATPQTKVFDVQHCLNSTTGHQGLKDSLSKV